MNTFVLEAEQAGESLRDFMSKAATAATLLKALSHESRLLILCILGQGEKTVGQLEDILGLQQAIVSQQLARLRLDNLVNSRREGRQIYYSVADPVAGELVAMLHRLYCPTDRPNSAIAGA